MQASPLDPFHVFLCASFGILLTPLLVSVFCLNGIVWLAFGFLSQAICICAFCFLLPLCVAANLRRNQPQAMLPPSEDAPRAIEGGGSADVILYVGLAMISLGLLITFLGLGEGTSGFKTMEMKLIGPSLVGCGVFFAVLRILFCTVRVILSEDSLTSKYFFSKMSIRFPRAVGRYLDAVVAALPTSRSWWR